MISPPGRLHCLFALKPTLIFEICGIMLCPYKPFYSVSLLFFQAAETVCSDTGTYSMRLVYRQEPLAKNSKNKVRTYSWAGTSPNFTRQEPVEYGNHGYLYTLKCAVYQPSNFNL